MMRKYFLLIFIFFIGCLSSFAAKIPDDVLEYINKEIPGADIRFDGVITFPSNTVYLPLYPSLFSDIKSLSIKQTYPANMKLKQEPDIVIFNNDFVLLKVLTDGEGHRTVLHQANPPLQIRTGLLPQDMLVPSGLIVPENIKGIIGNLKIDTKREDIIRVENEDSYEDFLSNSGQSVSQSLISQLKNKVLYVTTNYSKNIQVVNPVKTVPDYSLAQQSIPIDVKAVNNGKFLLVTTYERPFIDVISVADSRFIKQVALDSNPEEILLDYEHNKAYITSPAASMIYVLDLKKMSLIQKIKVNGYCEHLILSENKLFYVDKLQNEIWSIELQKEYELKDIGSFPNVSALAFADNKLFISSRTKSRVAVIDYDSLKLLSEFTTANKPVAMRIFDKKLYILGAESNEIHIINIDNYSLEDSIRLASGGFSTGLKRIETTDYAVVVDLKNNQYSVIDLKNSKLLKTYSLNIPLKDVIIADKVRLYD